MFVMNIFLESKLIILFLVCEYRDIMLMECIIGYYY